MVSKRPITRLVFISVMLASLFFSELGITPVYAAGITVNTAMDETITNGLCSLREAITNANNDASTYPDCIAGAETDTITFVGNYTITLVGSQLPAITSAIIINGNGAANTIIQASDCNPVTLPGGCTPATYRIFAVTSTGNLTLDSLTVRNAYCDGCGQAGTYGYGGGIFNYEGTVTVTNSTLSGNKAYVGGGIYNYGTLTVMDSTLSGNSGGFGISSGGGIYNDGGTLTLTNSTLSGNIADQGGGIYNDLGTLTLTNSTLSGNSATSTYYTYSEGGGIFNHSGTLTVTNSTLSGNSATSEGGGIFNQWGALALTNSSISGNSATSRGGGIISYLGTLNYANTIIANSPDGGDCYNDSGIINTSTNNLVEDGSCSASLSGDPLLGPLADNGGPTQTMALLPGSPAIDAGDDTVCEDVNTVNNLDQRGVTRPQGSHCDVGAYEKMDDSGFPTFDDVPTDAFAWAHIESIYEAGITSGCSQSPMNYCPGGTVTRAQMAVFLMRGIHGPSYTLPAATGTTFNDVPSNSFAAEFIEAFAHEGITSGCGGGNYCPNGLVSRAQMAVFLLRAKHGSSYSPPVATGTMFNDVPSNAFAAAWIEQLASEGITSGCGGGNYCPNTSVTRAQMAVFLQKTFYLPLP